MFDIEGGKIKLSADTLAIPPFKEYYNGIDDKAIALKDIEYIVWRDKWNTPYLSYPPEERIKRIGKDVYGIENFKPTKAIEELSKRFIEFQTTSLIRLYNAAEDGVEFLISTLDNLKRDIANEGDLTLEEKLKIAAGVSKLIKDVEPAAKSLVSAKKRAMAEESESGRVKGGGTIGLYELPGR